MLKITIIMTTTIITTTITTIIIPDITILLLLLRAHRKISEIARRFLASSTYQLRKLLKLKTACHHAASEGHVVDSKK